MRSTVAGGRLVLAWALAASAALPALAADYAVKLFDRPGALGTQLWDINDGSVIVGSARYADGRSSGFTYNAGVFTDFAGPTGAFQTNFTGISNSGLIVGFCRAADTLVGPTPQFKSFLFDGSHYTSFAVPGAAGTLLRRISSDGRYLTGDYTVDDTHYGFAYDRSTDAFATFGAGSIAQGANIDGVVVGSARTADAQTTGFEYDFATGVTSFSAIDGLERTWFRDINDVGAITGFSWEDGYRGFLLSGTGGLTTFGIAGAYDTAGYGLNNHNVMVGWYGSFDREMLRGFVATPVPEPQGWALMLFGVAVIGWRRRTMSW